MPISKTIAAISAITILAAIALIKGIDTIVLSLALSLIAGLGGYTLGKLKKS